MTSNQKQIIFKTSNQQQTFTTFIQKYILSKPIRNNVTKGVSENTGSPLLFTKSLNPQTSY